MGLTLDQLDGFNGFRLRGIDAGDLSGWYVNHAGDVNGDGIDDIIIGARKGNASGRFDAGEAYVVYGSASGFAADMDLSSLDGSNGFQINGVSKHDQAGRSVSAAGDVNGDGIDDIIIGAWLADPDGVNNAGESYVVFGATGGLGATVELADLDGTDGFRIDGGGEKFYTGYSVSAAGDINGDGIDDVIIGAWAADVNGLNKAGQAYVVYGSVGGFAADMDLSDLNGTNGFVLNGFAENESAGYSVADAGDLNNDGIDDIILSAFMGTANGQAEAGQSYVIFGSASGFSAQMSLDTLDGTNGFSLDGAGAGDRSGYSVAAAGDVNGDGIDDAIIGSRWVDLATGADVGQAYVVYGSAAGFAANMDLGSLDGSNGFAINGVAEGDWTGASVAGAGDVNGDGIGDLVVSAYLADPGGVTDAGSTFVIYGRAGGFGASLDLASLDYTEGFRVDGTEANAHSGRFVDGAGDLNADGFDDIIIGAFQDDQPGKADAGESYVVYGFATPTGAPVAADAAVSVAEDNSTSGQLSASDPDNDPLSFSLASGPTNGTVTIGQGGAYIYTPDADFFGTDSFTFSVTDANQGSETSTVSVTVSAEPDAPVAMNDGYQTQLNTPLAIGALTGVLANDEDADGDSLSVGLLSDATNGSLSLSADGSFTYIPDIGFEGVDGFEYQVTDGQTNATAWVEINVTGATPPPQWVGLSFGGNAAARTAVYSQDGTEAETIGLRYSFNNLSLGNSGIFVSGAEVAPETAVLSMLGSGLSVRASSDGSLARRLVDGSETIRFDLVEGAQFGDALALDMSLVSLGGAGQVSVDFYDDGALVETALLDVVGGSVQHDLAGETDFDAVVIGTAGALSFAIDDIEFLRTSTTPAAPIGTDGRVVTIDFTDAAGGPKHVSYAEDGVVLDTLTAGYFRDIIGLNGGSFELRATSGTTDTAKLSLLGEALGVRSYGTSDDVSVASERRTLDDAETISVALFDTAELGDASLIAFEFANVKGSGNLTLDFFDDGVLVEQTSIAVLSSTTTHGLAGETDFDEVVIGVTGSLGFDIAEMTLVRDELLGV